MFLEKIEICAFPKSEEASIKSWMFLVTSGSSVSITMLDVLVIDKTVIKILNDAESFCFASLSQEEAPKIAIDSALSILISFKAFLLEASPCLTNNLRCFLDVPVSRNRLSISSWISSLFLLDKITIVLLPCMNDNSLTRLAPTADHSRIT